MLDVQYFTKGMKQLNVAFPKQQLNQKQVELYYSYLNDLTNDQFRYAIKSFIATSEFMPTIAGIRKKVTDLEVNTEDKAREFESKIFSVDTDTLIKHFKHVGDTTAVKVIENNYKTLREANISDIKVLKSQLREQYASIERNEKKKQVIKNNNLQIKHEETLKKLGGK